MILWEFLFILNSNRVEHRLSLEQVDDDYDNLGLPFYSTKHICTFALKFDFCDSEDDRFTNASILHRYDDYEVIRFNLDTNTIVINQNQVYI